MYQLVRQHDVVRRRSLNRVPRARRRGVRLHVRIRAMMYDRDHSKEITMSDTTETAILAGGCFWGVQELLRRRDGVISTRVGYTGGRTTTRPTGIIRVTPRQSRSIFDPERISYRDILEFFFQIHDPTTKDRQGNDIGSDYRSEIFYHERRAAPGRRGHDRRRRRLGPVARQRGDRDQRGRPLLGGRGRAPGLPPPLPERLQLPLPAAGLEAATPRDRLTGGVTAPRPIVLGTVGWYRSAGRRKRGAYPGGGHRRALSPRLRER